MKSKSLRKAHKEQDILLVFPQKASTILPLTSNKANFFYQKPPSNEKKTQKTKTKTKTPRAHLIAVLSAKHQFKPQNYFRRPQPLR